MIVRAMGVHDVEGLPGDGFREHGDIAEEIPGAAPGREKGTDPPFSGQPSRERGIGGDGDLGFDAGGAKRGDLVDRDRGGAGPFDAGGRV